jgi:hypothetical protein
VAGATGWEWLVGQACCLLFGALRHCGQCTVGRFGGWVGRCGSPRPASRGLRWCVRGFGGERKRWRWLEPRGGSGWWVERVACSLVRFVTAASAWSVGLGGRSGAAMSPQPASRGLRWCVRGFGGERKYRWWLERRGGGGWWVERVACFLARFVTAASARSVGFGGRLGAAVSPRPASRGWRCDVMRFCGERKRWRRLGIVVGGGGGGWWADRFLPAIRRFVRPVPVGGGSGWC